MKHKLLFFAMTIVLGGMLIVTNSCKKEKIEFIDVTEIRLDKENITMPVGSTYRLTATILPENATDKTLVWKSDDESVAIVDKDGLVIAVKGGFETIISAATPKGDVKAICKVKVEKKVVPVSGITIDKESLKMKVGETYHLTAKVSPEDATDKSVVWKSEDESIATVDQEGLVTAVKGGSKTMITATSGEFSASCAVTIEEDVIPVKGITLDKEIIEMAVGSSCRLNATITPSDATDKTIIWDSSDETIAIVSSSGVIAALKEGDVTITAYSSDRKKSASCGVFIKDVKIALAKTTGIIGVNDNLNVAPYLKSNVSIDQSDVTLSSSDLKVAAVDGLNIVGKSAGKAKITVAYKYGESILEQYFDVEVEDTFLSFVEDIFTISGRGVVLTTTVKNGAIKTNDKVRIIQSPLTSKNYNVTIASLETNRKVVESATVGDAIGILMKEAVNKDDLNRGSAITTGDTKRLVATQKVYGTLLITGRKAPAYVGYKPMMSANNQTWIVKLVNAGEFEILMPNEVYYNIEFEVQDSKMLCVLGQVINIMEGGKTIGTFTVEDFSPMQLTFEDVPAASGK
mgnify:FL=1